eukprot:PLAT1156.1.p1 GENE.PLAT1156.1~~PLAT1156.1.p1  ORF type:complete len:142 (+),score=47.85 PLAT1156.1:47-472(+)
MAKDEIDAELLALKGTMSLSGVIVAGESDGFHRREAPGTRPWEAPKVDIEAAIRARRLRRAARQVIRKKPAVRDHVGELLGGASIMSTIPASSMTESAVPKEDLVKAVKEVDKSHFFQRHEFSSYVEELIKYTGKTRATDR